MATNDYEKDILKKQARRAKEIKALKHIEKKLKGPVDPKKPVEFNFSADDPGSFERPIALGNRIIEKKSDGNCVQIIIERKASEPVRYFSSSLNEWNPACFPEVTKELIRQPSGHYHGELLGLKPNGVKAFGNLDEFAAISKRPALSTKNLTKELLAQYPLKIDLFDMLRFEHTPLLSKPLSQRRELLEDKVSIGTHVQLIAQWTIGTGRKLHEKFIWALEQGYEGLIAKDPDSLYVPGSVDNDLIKVKKSMTLDLAVLGLYETPESRRAGKSFSALLVGSYNAQTKKFETIGKVKVGAKEDQDKIYAALPKLVKTGGDYAKVVDAAARISINPVMESIERKIPNKIVSYQGQEGIAVVEIKLLDVTYSQNWHSCNLAEDGVRAHSLRIPVYKQLRTDKTRVRDVSTTEKVTNFYKKTL